MAHIKQDSLYHCWYIIFHLLIHTVIPHLMQDYGRFPYRWCHSKNIIFHILSFCMQKIYLGLTPPPPLSKKIIMKTQTIFKKWRNSVRQYILCQFNQNFLLPKRLITLTTLKYEENMQDNHFYDSLINFPRLPKRSLTGSDSCLSCGTQSTKK